MSNYRTFRVTAVRRCLRVGCAWALAAGGCGGGARAELAAADAIVEVSASLASAVAEYQADLSRADDSREIAAARALAVRLRDDGADEASGEEHIEAFIMAMARLRADREAARARLAGAMGNVAALSEVAEGLRRLAIESMSLDDEMRRYFHGLAATWRDRGERTEAKR